jgi:hypothetical protein
MPLWQITGSIEIPHSGYSRHLTNAESAASLPRIPLSA